MCSRIKWYADVCEEVVSDDAFLECAVDIVLGVLDFESILSDGQWKSLLFVSKLPKEQSAIA